MGCMQSSTESQLSKGASSIMRYRLSNERYQVEIYPPSLENASIIRRMEFHDCGPSQVFVSFDMDKCFLPLVDVSSQSHSRNWDQNPGQPRSQIINSKSTRGQKFPKKSSQITVNH